MMPLRKLDQPTVLEPTKQEAAVEERRKINWSRLRHHSAPVIPLLLINIMAGFGQYLWAQDHLTDGLAPEAAAAITVMYAAVVESVAVYLMWAAHTALLAGDAAGWLRLGAYAAAAWAGFVNFSHWGQSSVIAGLVFAVLSGISPWLWSIYSRLQHRDLLRAAGLIEPRAVKFSRSRWLLHFGRTWRVYRAAVWAGVASPTEAIERFDPGPRVKRPLSIELAKWRLKISRPQNQPANPAPAQHVAPVDDSRPSAGSTRTATVASPPRSAVAVTKNATTPDATTSATPPNATTPTAATPLRPVAVPDAPLAPTGPADQVAWLARELPLHEKRTVAEWAALMGCSERTANRRLADATRTATATADGVHREFEESTA